MNNFIKIFFTLLLSVISFNAYALSDVSEYANIPQGLLLDNQIKPEQKDNEFDNSKDGYQSSYSMDNLIEKFNQEKYIEIKDEVKIKAEQNLVVAAKILGVMYKYGLGMDVNYDEAFKWLSRAAEAADPEAQHHLALMYSKGESVQKNLAISLKWLRIASLLTTDEAEKESILKDYKNVLISANRRQKASANDLVEKWLKDNGKLYLLDEEEKSEEKTEQQ